MTTNIKTYQNLIGGEWKAASGGEIFENHNPANHDDLVGFFPKATEEDTQDAIASAAESEAGGN